MVNNMSTRGYLTRAVQFFLGLDGVLHLLEVVSAVNEGAKITAILTSIHACIFFAGVYFVGHDHGHHEKEVEV
jgi:hypothetical protein